MKSIFWTRCWEKSVFIYAILIGSMIIYMTDADEVPAFFLKIAKNIPRVGRSTRHQDSYKTVKNFPRMSRRNDMESTENWPIYENPFAGPSKRRIESSALNAPDTWQNFPLAIEGPPELWRTLAGYSTDAPDAIDNEIWQRDKRIIDREDH